ncbi:MAG: Acylphosphatase [Actinobacteria bacterium]|nr:Acylphosphatase [Actinomycetota bacterium]
MTPAVEARRVLVAGRVQGVGFRWSAVAEGERLGLAGWARNLPDGRVEVHAQGDPRAVAQMVEWLRQGPPRAEVTGFSQQPMEPDAGLSGFDIRW